MIARLIIYSPYGKTFGVTDTIINRISVPLPDTDYHKYFTDTYLLREIIHNYRDQLKLQTRDLLDDALQFMSETSIYEEGDILFTSKCTYNLYNYPLDFITIKISLTPETKDEANKFVQVLLDVKYPEEIKNRSFITTYTGLYNDEVPSEVMTRELIEVNADNDEHLNVYDFGDYYVMGVASVNRRTRGYDYYALFLHKMHLHSRIVYADCRPNIKQFVIGKGGNNINRVINGFTMYLDKHNIKHANPFKLTIKEKAETIY